MDKISTFITICKLLMKSRLINIPRHHNIAKMLQKEETIEMLLIKTVSYTPTTINWTFIWISCTFSNVTVILLMFGRLP